MIFDEYFEAVLFLDPVYASMIGDHRFDDRLQQDGRLEYRLELRRLAESTLGALRKFDPSSLEEPHRTHYEALAWTLHSTLEGLEFPEHLLPLVPGLGMPGSFVHLASGHGAHPFRSAADYDAFLSRCAEFEKWIDTAIDNLREGLKRRVTHPRVVIETVLGAIRALTTDQNAETSVFYRPVRRYPDAVSAADRARLTAAWREAIEGRVLPAYERLATYLGTEYLPRCRITLGLSHLPRGRRWYAHRVRFFTTTRLKPGQIFALGERQVERLTAQMDDAAAHAGFDGRAAYQQSLQSDPDHYLPGGRPTLEAYEEIRARVEQALHEGLPGHHFQIALATENESLPRFLRYGYCGAYIEGWGLYAESLGDEVGLYADPASAFGRLVFELGRAGRLRDRVRAAQGERFDIRRFHQLLLEDGPLPLTVLEAKIERWLARTADSG